MLEKPYGFKQDREDDADGGENSNNGTEKKD